MVGQALNTRSSVGWYLVMRASDDPRGDEYDRMDEPAALHSDVFAPVALGCIVIENHDLRSLASVAMTI